MGTIEIIIEYAHKKLSYPDLPDDVREHWVWILESSITEYMDNFEF